MRLGLAVVIMALAVPAAAANDDIWRVYPVDGGGGTIAALPPGEADSPEPYWGFSMTCLPSQDWTATVSGIDAKALANAISSGESITVAVIADDNPDRTPISGYFPSISFGEMYGEWEYAFPFGLDSLDELGSAETLAVKGTGVDFGLPSKGTEEAFSKFRALCAALPAAQQ
jgi:hypothetical protein